MHGISIAVLLFCECMRVGEDNETADPSIIQRMPGWYEGEYDVMSTEETYAAVAGHRKTCRLQPDLLPT
jgi:hypothetical protein